MKMAMRTYENGDENHPILATVSFFISSLGIFYKREFFRCSSLWLSLVITDIIDEDV